MEYRQLLYCLRSRKLLENRLFVQRHGEGEGVNGTTDESGQEGQRDKGTTDLSPREVSGRKIAGQEGQRWKGQAPFGIVRIIFFDMAIQLLYRKILCLMRLPHPQKIRVRN